MPVQAMTQQVCRIKQSSLLKFTSSFLSCLDLFHGLFCGIRLLDMLEGCMLVDFLPQQMNRFSPPSSLNYVIIYGHLV